MKKVLLAALVLAGFSANLSAQQKAVEVSKVVNAEIEFDKLVERKGIKAGFLAVADPEGIVFKPNMVKISEFYSTIDKQPGKLTWKPKIARISANGDLAFTAGPYIYQNGKSDDDKVFGQYLSVWKLDNADNKLKLLIDLGIQHPEPEGEAGTDFKEPDATKQAAASKDPFKGKSVTLSNDNAFNKTLDASALVGYKAFFAAEGTLYFPGFEPMTGKDKVSKFLTSEGMSITAQTVNAGRATSNDLAYSYGTARIRKGNIVNNYNYVRIWEIDANRKWNILAEIFSTIE
ncbi:Cif family virulence factor [Mucilaginibacter pedocola]|nr:hypothetical protein [Mucilaginibacter pedocola]